MLVDIAKPPTSENAAIHRNSTDIRAKDGRAGTRNYIAVVAASNCAAHTAELLPIVR